MRRDDVARASSSCTASMPDALRKAGTPAALAALVKLGEEETREELVFLLRSKDPVLRAATARSLGGLGEHAPRGELQKLLADREPGARVAAAASLLRLAAESSPPEAPPSASRP